jgi:hypothetical protein
VKQEEVNQAARKGALVVSATGKLREKILERVRRLIDGVHYVALSDLLREINEIKAMLSRLRVPGSKYTVAIDAQIAQSLMLALLVVPARQAELRDGDGDSNGDGNGKTSRNGSAQEQAELAKAADDARRVAEQLWGKPDTVPTIEGWHRELSKLGAGAKLAGQLLVAPRTEGAEAHDSTGRLLVEVPAAPKALPSMEPQLVELHVRAVDTETGVAVVRVLSAADPDGAAISGLFDRRVRLVFDSEELTGSAKLLELAQVTDVPVQARVGVTRGLGTSGTRHDELLLKEVVDEMETRRRMSRRLLEMNAVTDDLFGA